MSQEKAKQVRHSHKSNKKSLEGRTTKISLDVYERAKKDAKYRKLSVDQYVDTLLREVLFKATKTRTNKKQDFLGYCPNCNATIKQSTLKSELPETNSKPIQTKTGILAKLLGTKDS